MRNHPQTVKLFFMLALIFFLEVSIAPLMGSIYGSAVIFFPAVFFFCVCLLPSRSAFVYAGIFGILRDSISLYPPGVWTLGFIAGVFLEQILMREMNMEKISARTLAAVSGVALSYGVAFLVIAFYNHAMPPGGPMIREAGMNGVWIVGMVLASRLTYMRFLRYTL